MAWTPVGGGLPQRGMNHMGQMNQGQMWPQQQMGRGQGTGMGIGRMTQGGMMGQPGMNLAMATAAAGLAQNRMGQCNTMQPGMIQADMMGPGSMNMGGMMPQRMGSGMMQPLGLAGMNMAMGAGGNMQPRMGQSNVMQPGPGIGEQGMGPKGMGQIGQMGMGQYGMGTMVPGAPSGGMGEALTGQPNEALTGQPGSNDNTPLQSEGPGLLDMSPTRIYFTPGFQKNIKMVMLACVSLRGVAFKVQIHKSSLDFYTVTPVKGIVLKDKPMEVAFELDAKHTEDDLTRADPKCHRFHIQAIRWPPNVKEFDVDLWKQLEITKKDEMQTISVEVMLDVKDVGYKDKLASKQDTGKDDVHVALNPAKITFKKQYGKSQIFVSKIKSLGSDTGFNIRTNKPLLYRTYPSRGVIQAGKTESLEFELPANVTKEMLAAEKGEHKFVIQTIVFPKSGKYEFNKFEPALWKQLRQKGEILNEITIMVEHVK